MVSRKGSLLERNVKKIFDLAGFKTKQNIRLAGYEVDVYAKYKGFDVIIECKQREKSSVNLPNLIYTWTGKNKKIGATRVLLVIYGQRVSREHLKLAREENVIIWNEDHVDKFMDLAIEKKDKSLVYILDSLGITTEEVKKLRKRRVLVEEEIKIPQFGYFKGKIKSKELREWYEKRIEELNKEIRKKKTLK